MFRKEAVLTPYLIWNPLLVPSVYICLSELFFGAVLISQVRSSYEGYSRTDFLLKGKSVAVSVSLS